MYKRQTYKTLKASTSSITFPAADTETTNRVRAYKGQEYSNEISATVIPVIATPGNVKAVSYTNLRGRLKDNRIAFAR